MDPESMVHALEKIHGPLKPSGLLINIQPTGEPPSIEVHNAGLVDHTGWMGDRRNFASYIQALEALAQSVESGMFVVERESTFPFLYHADSWLALQSWLAEDWKSAILDESTAQRAQELLNETGKGSEVVVREEILIARLRPQ